MNELEEQQYIINYCKMLDSKQFDTLVHELKWHIGECLTDHWSDATMSFMRISTAIYWSDNARGFSFLGLLEVAQSLLGVSAPLLVGDFPDLYKIEDHFYRAIIQPAYLSDTCKKCGKEIERVCRNWRSFLYWANPNRTQNTECKECSSQIYKLRTMPYKDYLQTPHWMQLREKALLNADYRCQLCNSPFNLHVHHRTYERRGCELATDLTVLCSDCHAKFHNKDAS